MTPLTCQRIIAVMFLGMGGWCLVAPASINALAIRPEAQVDSATFRLMIGCFGAQAMLVGLLAATARFTRTTFLAFGLAMLPFFAFNYWFYVEQPILNELMALDFIANLAFVVLCVIGWRRGPASPAEIFGIKGPWLVFFPLDI
ncbi:hypothetical protein D3874_24260 [Oleomonas cavernae]|uniref:DoxX family protein n=2 Tax=Oleomonas cavernae TaxID=2320859 RepID=A0A418WI24_9PROT|nr:hypothetical protein D3874_24260 [Oleomonas cavernae]